MRIYDYMKRAFQETVEPDLDAPGRELRRVDGRIADVETKILHLEGKIARLHAKLTSLRTEIDSMKGEPLAEIRRLDVRIDGLDRELRTAIDIRERLASLEARLASA